MLDEWDKKKDKKTFQFTEEEKDILVEIYMERNRKLKRDQQGHYINLDPEYLFYIANCLFKLFDADPRGKNKVNQQLEIHMTKVIAGDYSIVDYAKNRLSEEVTERSIAILITSTICGHIISIYGCANLGEVLTRF